VSIEPRRPGALARSLRVVRIGAICVCAAGLVGGGYKLVSDMNRPAPPPPIIATVAETDPAPLDGKPAPFDRVDVSLKNTTNGIRTADVCIQEVANSAHPANIQAVLEPGSAGEVAAGVSCHVRVEVLAHARRTVRLKVPADGKPPLTDDGGAVVIAVAGQKTTTLNW
jgi:hypothetical protein